MISRFCGEGYGVQLSGRAAGAVSAAIGLFVLLAPASSVALPLEAELALTSDYRYRALSRSEDKPSLQLNLSTESVSGYYAGAGLAQIRQDSRRGGELLLYAGRYFERQPWYLEVDLRRYQFSPTQLRDYTEATLLLGFGPLALDLALSDRFAEGEKQSRFARLSVDYDLSATLAVGAGIGYQGFRQGDAYLLGELTLNTMAAGLDWQLGYSQSEGRQADEQRLQLTVSRRF
ncbi:TorF family putative porin [Marinobacterium jannaschii]|uniref:TorF family putative porin n=1 Tax=Marinobacterium jannaschii TaxID=64970 RepID=UPI0004816127|nr:TorF family putative porin [Marinobacterium jannaschii]